MARHASQAVLSRVIGSFGDSVKYYFLTKNRIIQFLQCVIYEVLFYHIFFVVFSGFTTPRRLHLLIVFYTRVSGSGSPCSFSKMIASLAALAKACKKVT